MKNDIGKDRIATEITMNHNHTDRVKTQPQRQQQHNNNYIVTLY